MKLQFIDIPVYYSTEVYEQEIQLMAHKLMSTGKVLSVFQVGGVNNPGISDVDLFVVFKDNVSYEDNPVKNLNYPSAYLFTHKLFGTNISNAVKLEQFTFFNSYKHISGDVVNMTNYTLTDEERTTLKHQIAIEYLIKAYLSVFIGIEYRVIKLRSFLLHAKAILYDFDFLDIREQNLIDTINSIVEIRNNWFQSSIPDEKISKLVIEYRDTLIDAINQSINKHKIYLPIKTGSNISRNISIYESDSLNLKRVGPIPPRLMPSKPAIFNKINNRLNTFQIHLPYENETVPEIIQKRYDCLKSTFSYNQNSLPNFIPTGHGLNIFE